MNLGAIEVSEESLRFLVAAETVSNHQERPVEVATQLLHKRKEIGSGESRGAHGEIQPQTLLHGGNGDRAGHRKAIVTVPTVMDRRLPPRRPRPADHGLQHEVGFINEDKGAALTLGFFCV